MLNFKSQIYQIIFIPLTAAIVFFGFQAGLSYQKFLDARIEYKQMKKMDLTDQFIEKLQNERLASSAFLSGQIGVSELKQKRLDAEMNFKKIKMNSEGNSDWLWEGERLDRVRQDVLSMGIKPSEASMMFSKIISEFSREIENSFQTWPHHNSSLKSSWSNFMNARVLQEAFHGLQEAISLHAYRNMPLTQNEREYLMMVWSKTHESLPKVKFLLQERGIWKSSLGELESSTKEVDVFFNKILNHSSQGKFDIELKNSINSFGSMSNVFSQFRTIARDDLLKSYSKYEENVRLNFLKFMGGGATVFFFFFALTWKKRRKIFSEHAFLLRKARHYLRYKHNQVQNKNGNVVWNDRDELIVLFKRSRVTLQNLRKKLMKAKVVETNRLLEGPSRMESVHDKMLRELICDALKDGGEALSLISEGLDDPQELSPKPQSVAKVVKKTNPKQKNIDIEPPIRVIEHSDFKKMA